MHKTTESPKFGDVKSAFYYASISFRVCYLSLYYALHETMKTVYNYKVKHVPRKDLFFYIVHSPTNTLFINLFKRFKFTLKYTIISLLHVSVFNDHQVQIKLPDDGH